jgi:hypothetical protein
MTKILDLREHMEVLGSDGKHVGTVDHAEGPDRVKLTKDDSPTGQHRYLSWDWVDRVEGDTVYLNMTSTALADAWRKNPDAHIR